MSKVGRPRGYVVSEITRRMISDASQGRIPPNRRKISIAGVVYDSIRAASLANNLPPATLRHRVLSNSERFKDWIYV
jgi:hypothetical protein